MPRQRFDHQQTRPYLGVGGVSSADSRLQPTMPDILHDFPIRVPPARVFEAVSTPAGLDRWWTARSTGAPGVGFEYQLWFGPEYDWRATVSQCDPPRAFELTVTVAMPDWTGTRVGFQLEERPFGTQVRFWHAGWAAADDHFRTSSYCWAMYLRILQRALEHGEDVPYPDRLTA
jgi:uncharacterized protein YndB with AHSA1/START domain